MGRTRPFPHVLVEWFPFPTERVVLSEHPSRAEALAARAALGTGRVLLVEPLGLPKPFSGPRYTQNADRVPASEDPCVLCGRAVKAPAPMLRVVDGGDRFGTLAEPHDAGDMDYFPIGPDCLRKHPALRFLAVSETEENPCGCGHKLPSHQPQAPARCLEDGCTCAGFLPGDPHAKLGS